MKLLRVGEQGMERPTVLRSADSIVYVDHITPNFDGSFFSDSNGLNSIIEALPKLESEPLKGRVGAPIANPSKIVCIGLNYTEHAMEGGMAIPEEPVLFLKAPSAITGPFDNINIPRNSEKTDWEVELAIVIGREASYVEENQALDHVFGYMIHNDVSERHFQLERGGQWVKGKSADTFAPIGPWLVTADEVEDANALDLWLKVNGETVQSSNTSDMIFDIRQIVSYASKYMTLLPGDMITTGTPAGVGLGMTPPRYLRPGDVVELGIAGLGIAKQHVVAYEESN